MRSPGKKAGLLGLLCLMSFTLVPEHKITIYLIGDSTMADKKVQAYPETGWGMPFHYFFNASAKVDNRAQNGRSTRTFMEEGRWKAVMAQLQPGDFVLVQFGHNDEVPTKRSYTPPDQFSANLLKFVRDAREKNAIPVLITPVSRRSFDSLGHLVDTHVRYAGLVREVARKNQVPLIDLDQQSMELLERFGPKRSEYLFDHLAPGENPHYPKGNRDNTHFSELGARKIAELVLKDLIRLEPALAPYLRNGKQK